jgi:5-(carboxyamino)imidazole ribonucleotide synthase
VSRTVLPGSTIGIVGGGQLGRMLALEARRMDYRTVVLDPDSDAPAGQVADEHIVAPLTDLDAARKLATRSDVVTLEWENADVAAMTELSKHVPVRPGPHVLQVAQNRLREKQAARNLGLSTAPFAQIRSLADLRNALEELGTPAVLKTTFGGYDGRGQRVIHDADDAAGAFEELGDGEFELVLEGWVDFRLEASVICARSPDGFMASFPVVENVHRNAILDLTIAPARIGAELAARARLVGEALTSGLDVVGLLAVELFITRDDRVLVNEIAPRPHNSGHYTWEACSVSQFEQQLRAVCGLPLEVPELLRPATMANLLGDHVGTGRQVAGFADALGVPMTAVHLYGKAEARAGRKIGHLTALGADQDEATERATRARELFSGTSFQPPR